MSSLQWHHKSVTLSGFTAFLIICPYAFSSSEFCPFMRRNHQWLVDSTHRGKTMRKVCPSYDILMIKPNHSLPKMSPNMLELTYRNLSEHKVMYTDDARLRWYWDIRVGITSRTECNHGYDCCLMVTRVKNAETTLTIQTTGMNETMTTFKH